MHGVSTRFTLAHFLKVEIKQLHLRNEHMSKENLLNKEAVEHLKLAFTEEKL